MNPEEVKEKIALAKRLVAGEEDVLYKTEAFKIILSKLLESGTVENKINSDFDIKKPMKKSTTYDMEEKKQELANKSNITVDELERVFFIRDDVIEINSPLSGSDARKHVVVTQCLLAAYLVIFGQEWVSSEIIIECLRSMGVKSVTNLSLTLRKYGDLIISKGTRGHKEYRLTSGRGKILAFDVIHKLAKGEEL